MSQGSIVQCIGAVVDTWCFQPCIPTTRLLQSPACWILACRPAQIIGKSAAQNLETDPVTAIAQPDCAGDGVFRCHHLQSGIGRFRGVRHCDLTKRLSSGVVQQVVPGGEASWEQRAFPVDALPGEFLLLASPDGRDGSWSSWADEVLAVSQRKWNKLGKPGAQKGSVQPRLNFGGGGTELWCNGGERAFVKLMIEQSALIPKRVLWFTSLVSQSDNLPHIEAALKKAKVVE